MSSLELNSDCTPDSGALGVSPLTKRDLFEEREVLKRWCGTQPLEASLPEIELTGSHVKAAAPGHKGRPKVEDTRPTQHAGKKASMPATEHGEKNAGRRHASDATNLKSRSAPVTAPTDLLLDKQPFSSCEDAAAGAPDFNIWSGSYNPVRPPGIGEMKPGEASDQDKGNGIDWRKANAMYDSSDGTTSYSYYGELEDGFIWDTEFTAEERVDKDNRIISTYVVYETPVDIDFQSPDGTGLDIRNVVKVETELNESTCNYDTVVTTADGRERRFVLSAEGQPQYYEDAYYFQYRKGVAR